MATRVELIQQLKQSEFRYLRALKEYLAEQKSLREQLLALEGVDELAATVDSGFLADSPSKEARDAKEEGQKEEEQEETKKKGEARKQEDAKKKKDEEDAKKKKEHEEQAKKKKVEEEAKKKEEQAKKKREQDEQAKKKKDQEEQAKKKKDEEEKSKKLLAVATASSPGAASSPSTKRKPTAASGGLRVAGEATPQQMVFQRLMTKAAQEESTATEQSNKELNKTPKSAVDACAANDPSFSVLDLTGNTVFSMKKREYCELLGEALKGNTHVHTVKLAKCSLDAIDAKAIAQGLAANDSVELLDLSSNKINNDGAKAIAMALRTNTRLTELNLLGQPSAFGDSCLEEFVALFSYNVTLTKIIWRLDSRKSFAINKLLVRNNTIIKWLSESKDVSSLVPASCNIPELAQVAANELHKARSVSSAPRLVPFKKEPEQDLPEQGQELEQQPEDEEVVAEQPVEEDTVEHVASPVDAWWLIDATTNGTLEDDGRTLLHNGGEEGGGACISFGSLCFSSGVVEFTVINSAGHSVLVGVTNASPERFDKTDAAKNKQRFVCSFFNGKAFGPENSFSFLEPASEIIVRLDLDERKLYFAGDGGEFGDAAFENLPPGLWRPYFALGHDCSITVI